MVILNSRLVAALGAAILAVSILPAQPAAPAPGAGRGAAQPQFVSPEVTADRHIVFRVLAPRAQSVSLQAGDIPAAVRGPGQLTKSENGIWELSIGPVDPGAYRYTFSVDGVSVIDSRNPATTESNNNPWSLVVVPGSDVMDPGRVPHGAVARVYYYSTALERDRRMHIYTPPGYEAEQQKYPVFYLLHGASDTDDAWTTVGRAAFIFDNLIASKKAKPMIVVMPAGHTTRIIVRSSRDEFTEDFLNDVWPYVEKNYRVMGGAANRAIAGLSMGGGQTLNVAFARPGEFGYIGVYSSGILSARGGSGPFAAAWEEQHKAALEDAAMKKAVKLFWFSTGTEDSLMANTRETVDLFKRHGFTPVFQESPGGHTWINWRNYLLEFTPKLFQ